MIPLNPNQSVANLKGDLGGRFESSYWTMIADSTVYQKERVTVPALASITSGDYFHVTMPSGQKVAVWLDKAGTNSAPGGAVYTAANVKIRANVSAQTTAAQVAAVVKTAIDAASGAADNLSVIDNLDGTLDIEVQEPGSATWERHNANDSGNGSVTLAELTASVASNYQSKYITLRSGADSAFYAWFNVASLGSDPAPGGTGISVAVSAKLTAAQLATALAAAIDANANFEAVADSARVRVTNSALGDSTDIGAGNSPAVVGDIAQGGSQRFAPSMSPESISNNPSTF